MRVRSAVAALALALATGLAGCKTPEEKLVDRRHALGERLDRLHARYVEESGEAAAPAGGGILGRIVSGAERTAFEQHCLAVGRGERPFTLSDRLAAFMSRPENARACRDAAELQLEIAALERTIADPRGR